MASKREVILTDGRNGLLFRSVSRKKERGSHQRVGSGKIQRPYMRELS